MVNIQEYVDIKPFSSLKVGGQFRYFAIVERVEDLKDLIEFAKEKNVKIFILGGGSNMVFSDGIIDVLVLKIEIKGFEIVSESDDYTDIKVGAGEIWDAVVSRTVDIGLSGLESLSAIPGTVGASPVQNIGAYGAEVKDSIKEVEVYEIETGKIFNISNKDCKFGYRDSIFKNEAKGKYIITAVAFRLHTEPTKNSHEKVEGRVGLEPVPDHFHENFSSAPYFVSLSYPGVMKFFEDKGIANPNLKQIREAIIEIRNSKLPNSKELPNVGSFFKNPIVRNEIADKIIKDFPDAKFFMQDDGFTKIPAGWLIESAGLKGKSFGSVSVYSKNALILVNSGDAKSEDIINARNEIIKIVKEKFGIELEQEPEII